MSEHLFKRMDVSYQPPQASFDEAINELTALVSVQRPAIIDIRENPRNPGAHAILACGFNSQTRELLVMNPALPFPGLQAFRRADRDGNGCFSAEEFPRPEAFKDVDQDGEGELTSEDVRTRSQPLRESGHP